MPHIFVGGSVMDPMGMNKNGDQSVPGSSTDAKVINWTARSGYPNTVITNNELVATGSGSVIVRCGVTASGVLIGGVRRFQLMHNNTAVTTAESDQGTITLANTPLNLVPGDRLWLRVTLTVNYATTIVGGVNTYLYYDLA
ncbi:hypothetical protein ACWEKT_03120 [Nocardia takedensis]